MDIDQGVWRLGNGDAVLVIVVVVGVAVRSFHTADHLEIVLVPLGMDVVTGNFAGPGNVDFPEIDLFRKDFALHRVVAVVSRCQLRCLLRLPIPIAFRLSSDRLQLCASHQPRCLFP